MTDLADAIDLLKRRSHAGFGSAAGEAIEADRILSPMKQSALHFRATLLGTRSLKKSTWERARARWTAAGQTLTDDFTLGEIRALCSESDVLTHPRFILGVRTRPECLQRRSIIEAMIRTYFLFWQPNEGRPALEELLTHAVHSYSGPSRKIERCKQASGNLFSPLAAEWLARETVRKRASVRALLEHWGVSLGTELGIAACGKVPGELVRLMKADRAGALPELVDYFKRQVSVVDAIAPHDMGPLVAELIRAARHPEVDGIQLAMKEYVLDSPRYGDPRLSANASKWAYVGEEARQIVSGWLSKESLEFFFREVLPDKTDVHGRKNFWLQYLGEVQDCLVVLSEADEARLINKLDKRAHIGRMDGSKDTSAFLMQFRGARDLLVIEFSRSGNALYLHDYSAFAEATYGGLRKQRLRFHLSSGLKNHRSMIDTFTHTSTGTWQPKVRATLSRHGIRPK